LNAGEYYDSDPSKRVSYADKPFSLQANISLNSSALPHIVQESKVAVVFRNCRFFLRSWLSAEGIYFTMSEWKRPHRHLYFLHGMQERYLYKIPMDFLESYTDFTNHVDIRLIVGIRVKVLVTLRAQSEHKLLDRIIPNINNPLV